MESASQVMITLFKIKLEKEYRQNQCNYLESKQLIRQWHLLHHDRTKYNPPRKLFTDQSLLSFKVG